MQGWQPDAAPGYGWPLGERTWINPSPNAPNLWMARAYAGTVMLEGTTLSEGRGTTRPLEIFGAPDIDARAVTGRNARPSPRTGSAGCQLREIWFEPTFHKHAGKLCNGLQIHVEDAALRPRRLPPLAPAGARLQGHPPALSRLSAVARLRLRIRARAAGHRPDQRLAAAARHGWTTLPRTPAQLDAPSNVRRVSVARPLTRRANSFSTDGLLPVADRSYLANSILFPDLPNPM